MSVYDFIGGQGQRKLIRVCGDHAVHYINLFQDSGDVAAGAREGRDRDIYRPELATHHAFEHSGMICLSWFLDGGQIRGEWHLIQIALNPARILHWQVIVAVDQGRFLKDAGDSLVQRFVRISIGGKGVSHAQKTQY